MKLKVRNTEVNEIETNSDSPIYLYFQDELNEEYIKITEKEKITIKFEPYKKSVSYEMFFILNDINFEKDLISEECFNEAYSMVLKN